jgi:hypothetical protein
MRNDTSVPGITKERGKLPASSGVLEPVGRAPSGSCASRSIQRSTSCCSAFAALNSSARTGNATVVATNASVLTKAIGAPEPVLIAFPR